MSINTEDKNLDAAAKNPTAASPASKPPKARKAKAPRKISGVASARSAASRTAAPVEILFEDLPNPYQLPTPPYIWIDYPEQGERLLGPLYNIRLGVGGAEQVDLSIDGSVWKDCRLTSGYWWYDWSAIRPGRHTLVARMRTADGRWFRTPTRNCDYRP